MYIFKYSDVLLFYLITLLMLQLDLKETIEQMRVAREKRKVGHYMIINNHILYIYNYIVDNYMVSYSQ